MGGLTLPVWGGAAPRRGLFRGRAATDRILVLITLDGGNDGLNTVIPFEDSLYYHPDLRPTLAISPQSVLKVTEGFGFHPGMRSLSNLFSDGKMALVQGVGYDNPDLSHFRSMDIWLTASDSDEYLQSGWIGRFLEQLYPDFPEMLPEDPMGIQLGSSYTLGLRTIRGDAGLVLSNPSQLHSIVGANYVGAAEDSVPDTLGGEELSFVRSVDDATFHYSGRVYEAAEQGSNSSDYPGTALGQYLSIVSRLISGGLQTPVYKVHLFGFDTHANQAAEHATLLNTLSEAVWAFQSDMEKQGLAEKIVVATISEFGRRVAENGSLGTDHGTAAPMFLVGHSLHSGIFGQNPDLENLDERGNLQVQYDFRQILWTILREWFNLSEEACQYALTKPFDALPLFNRSVAVIDEPSLPTSFRLEPPYPNPFNSQARVSFTLPKRSQVALSVYDLRGRRVMTVLDGVRSAGRHATTIDASRLSSGTYLLRLEAGSFSDVRRLTLVK